MKTQEKLIIADYYCDKIPVVSSITNLVNIILKVFVNTGLTLNQLENNHFFTHLEKKSFLKCFVLLVPILGNVLCAYYQFPDAIPDDYFLTESEKKTLPKIESLKKSIFDRNLQIERFFSTINANPELQEAFEISSYKFDPDPKSKSKITTSGVIKSWDELTKQNMELGKRLDSILQFLTDNPQFSKIFESCKAQWIPTPFVEIIEL